MSKPLDPKTVGLHPAGHLAQEWQVRVPAGIAFGDIFRHAIWADVEKIMQKRGPKRPREDDLLRVIGHDFDVICLVTSVGGGYGLELYAGKRPSPVAQVLHDLGELPDASTSAELKEQAKALGKRWRAAGVTRDNLSSARKAYAKTSHPDTNETNGRRLAAANAVIDAALDGAFSVHAANVYDVDLFDVPEDVPA